MWFLSHFSLLCSAWTVAKDISKLQRHEIEAYVNEPSKKSGDLREGYQIALDPEKWLAEKEAQAQEHADAEANAAIDQLDSEEEGADSKTKSKKRKRESDAGLSAKAKSKSKPKKSSEEPGKKKGAGAGKVKKNGTKSKAMIESEDEGGPEDEDEGPSKKPTSPVAKKAKRDKAGDDDGKVTQYLQAVLRGLLIILYSWLILRLTAILEGDEEAKRVREWRHKLQKVFLTPKTSPKPEVCNSHLQLYRHW